jgi:hypothetical protein
MNSNTSLQAFAPISQVRRRNEALKYILPKIFGIISEKDRGLRVSVAARRSSTENSHCQVFTWVRIALC